MMLSKRFDFMRRASLPIVRKGVVLTQDMQGRGCFAVLSEISNEVRAEASLLDYAEAHPILWKIAATPQIEIRGVSNFRGR